MSSSEQIVIDAYGMLALLDLNETAPSPVEMTKGLRALSAMLDAWASEGMNVIDQTITGDFVDGEKTVTSIEELTSKLAPGMTVAATGLSGRIVSIDSDTQVTLDTAATADGSAASIECTFLPVQARFDEAIAAQLAIRIANLAGMDAIPQGVGDMARRGINAIMANYFVVPRAQLDRALLSTSIRTVSGG
jgi:hypothetical protein